MTRTFRIVLGIVVAMFACAPAHGQITAVSSGDHAWVAARVEGERAVYQALSHVQGRGTFGRSLPVFNLPENARLLCAIANRVLYVLDPEVPGEAENPAIIRVREIAARQTEGPLPFYFAAPTALPHVPAGLRVLDGAGIGQRAYILASAQGGVVSVFVLGQSDWEFVRELPFGSPDTQIAERSSLSMFAVGQELSIIRDDGDVLERLTFDPLTDEIPTRGVLPASGKYSGVQAVGGRVLAIEELEASRRIVMFTGGGGGGGATIELSGDVPAGSRVVDLGGNAGVIWQGEAGELYARVVSLSGIELFSGPLGRGAIIQPEELQVVGLVLGSGLLSIVFFVWRPLERASVVDFPSGFALADPSRRATAWGVDMAISVLLASLFWRTGPAGVALLAPVGDSGILPTLGAIAIFVLHTSIGDATRGRSLGKAFARVRVIDRTGGAPGFGRALLRNFIRGMCPTLGLAILMGPIVREPWACGTFVVMEIDRGAEPPESDEQSSQPDSADGSD